MFRLIWCHWRLPLIPDLQIYHFLVFPCVFKNFTTSTIHKVYYSLKWLWKRLFTVSNTPSYSGRGKHVVLAKPYWALTLLLFHFSIFWVLVEKLGFSQFYYSIQSAERNMFYVRYLFRCQLNFYLDIWYSRRFAFAASNWPNISVSNSKRLTVIG